MATAAVEFATVKVVLELNLEEALYNYSALNRVNPVPDSRFGEDGYDPVYEALKGALAEAGIDPVTNLAESLS